MIAVPLKPAPRKPWPQEATEAALFVGTFLVVAWIGQRLFPDPKPTATDAPGDTTAWHGPEQP